MRSKGKIKQYFGCMIFNVLIAILLPRISGKFDVLEPMKTGGTESFHISNAKKTSLTKRCTLNANTYKVRLSTCINMSIIKFQKIPGRKTKILERFSLCDFRYPILYHLYPSLSYEQYTANTVQF